MPMHPPQFLFSVVVDLPLFILPSRRESQHARHELLYSPALIPLDAVPASKIVITLGRGFVLYFVLHTQC